METHPGKSIDRVIEPDRSSELVKLIRKLRWIGMEREAERLQRELRRAPASDSVLASPRETD
jgi:hypothetical protein